MGYFAAVATDAGLAFGARYTARFGPQRAGAQRARRGLLRRGAAAGRAGRAGRHRCAVPALDAVADGTDASRRAGPARACAAGMPRQPVYLARADGLDFDVIVAGF